MMKDASFDTTKLMPSWNPANLASKDGFIKEVFRLHDIQQETTAPAQVVSYDRDNHRVTVKILVQRAYNTADGAAYVDWPEFTVPVILPQTGMMLIDMPIYPGDTGYVVAGHRDGATAIAKNSGITDAPSTKSSASSTNNASANSRSGGGGGGSSVSIEDTSLSASVEVSIFAESDVGAISGTYFFKYSNSVWTLNGANINLSDFGISLQGTPLEGASIECAYTTPVGGAGGSVLMKVTQGISNASYSYSTPSGGGLNGASSSNKRLTNGEKISKSLAGANKDIRSLLGTSKNIKSLKGTSIDRRLASDIRSMVGTSGDIKTLAGTPNIKRRIKAIVDKVVEIFKDANKNINEVNGDSKAAESSSSTEKVDASDSSSSISANAQNDQVTANTTNEGPQPPDTFLLHRYENGYFVPSKFGEVKIDSEDELNLVIANTRKVEDGKTEDGKQKYRQEVFGKLTISRDGKIVADAPAGYEIRSDVDIMGGLVVDGAACVASDMVIGADLGVAGATEIGGDAVVEGEISVGGDAQLDEKLTVGKSYRKAIIDPHQDLGDGDTNGTAKFRRMSLITGIHSENDERIVFDTKDAIVLATKGESKKRSVAKPIVDILPGDNIKVQKNKSGNKTIFTISGEAGGGGGGSATNVDNRSISILEDQGTKKLQLFYWKQTGSGSAEAGSLNDITDHTWSYWLPVRKVYGSTVYPLQYMQYIPEPQIFKYSYSDHTIDGGFVRVGRAEILCSSLNIGENYSGSVYIHVKHPGTGYPRASLVMTSGDNSLTDTYMSLYGFSNGFITADYRYMPTVPMYE